MALSATWSNNLSSAPVQFNPNDVVWSPELGIFAAVGASDKVATSPDGITWTYRTIVNGVGTAITANWTAITWSPSLGKFAIINNNSGSKVATSTDGVTWTLSASFAFSATAMTWAPSLNLFCATGGAGINRFYTSPDGINWTARTGPNQNYESMCWSNDLTLFVAFSSNPATAANIATSPDGINWTSRSFPETAACDDGNKRVIWVSDLSLFIGLATPTSLNWPTIFTSPNGTTWTARLNPDFDELEQAEFSGLAYIDSVGAVICIGSDGSGDLYSAMTSPDGISWAWAVQHAQGGDWNIPCYAEALDTLIVLEDNEGDEVLLGTDFVYAAIYPNRGNPAGDSGEVPYTVTIKGDGSFGGFSNALAVYFDNDLPTITNPATYHSMLMGSNYWEGSSLTVVNSTTLTVKPPNGKTKTHVIVFGFYNGSYRILADMPAAYADFTYEDPAILSVLPATGNGGDTITITGEFLYDTGTQEIDTSGEGPHGDYFGEHQPGHRLSVVWDDLTETDIDGEDVNVISATSMTAVMPYHAEGTGAVVGIRYRPAKLGFRRGQTYEYSYSEMTLPAVFTYTAQQWGIPALGYYGDDSIDAPEDIEFPWPDWVDDIYYPPFTIYEWEEIADPLETGWWHSINEGFAGTGIVIYNGRPKAPRGFGKLTPFATGSAGMMGGFPGPCCVLNNRMVYAENVYTDVPIIRLFNGALDRELVRVPKTAALATPIAVMTMIAANNTIYFSTLDSGTTSANWAGRVFSLDPISGTLTLLGAAFGSGQVPYALAWHMGRLWCGTNSADPAVAGNVYFIRPGIDTTWTTDEAMSAHSMSGVTSMLPFAGNLYVGTSAAALTRAKVLVRDSLGVYTTSDTGTGGAAAAANNCFPALTEFNGALYNSYWNPTAPLVSLIRKLSGTWSTVYTGTGATLKPFIAFPQDDDVLLAVGGGLTYDVGLARTTDGTTWVDRTSFLQQFAPSSTGLPAFGVLKR